MKTRSFLAAIIAHGSLAANTCSSGLHLIAARGTGEPVGPGAIGRVAEGVAAVVPGSSVVGLDYPAKFQDYRGSEAAGVRAFRDIVGAYAADCPESKVALLGYSQGAQVAGDFICGGRGMGFSDEEPISPSIMDKHVVAVVLMGDPTHTKDKSWNKGTSNQDGVFPRSDTKACDPYADRIRSYCDTGDVFCDSGRAGAVHKTYLATYKDDALNFIVSRFNASKSVTATGVSTPSSPSPTQTPGSGATTYMPNFVLLLPVVVFFSFATT